VYAGDSGVITTAVNDTLPQVICLLVVACLAAMVIGGAGQGKDR
jgi:hypothetical protein